MLTPMNSGIGEFIRAWRRTNDVSQTDLAETLGMARAHLAQIEGGKIALPSADVRRRLALGCFCIHSRHL